MMRTLCTTILSVMALMLAPISHAQVSQQLLIEDMISKRVEREVLPYDPAALVNVRLSFKKTEVSLPGANLQLLRRGSLAGSDVIDTQDIESIKVTVRTSGEAAPAWLKDSVRSAIKFDGVSVSFAFTQLAPDARAALDHGKNVDKPDAQIAIMNRNFQQWVDSLTLWTRETQATLKKFVVVGGVGLAVFLLSLLALTGMGLKGLAATLRSGVEAVVGQMSQSQPNGTAPARAASAFAPAAPTARPVNDAELSIGYDTLVSLLADCYWTQNDEYALHLWRSARPEQHSRILSEFTFLNEYIRHCQPLVPRDLSLHDHPAYCVSSPFIYVSQEDVAGQLRRHRGLWHVLTPLRASGLQLSLQEKLVCVSSSPLSSESFDAIEWPASPLRKFQTSTDFGQISFEDEDQILGNPEIVPAQVRVSIHSLVWLAMLPLESRQAVLKNPSAQIIASVWSASDRTLHLVSEAIGERKLRLVQDYVSASSVALDRDLIKQISVESVQLLAKLTGLPNGDENTDVDVEVHRRAA